MVVQPRTTKLHLFLRDITCLNWIMRYQTTDILQKMPQPRVVPLTHLRTSSILTVSGPPKSWTKIDEDLEARLHSSVFYLEGHMVSDKKTNKRLSEDHPNLGVNICQRASGNSLKSITQTKDCQCESVRCDVVCAGFLFETIKGWDLEMRTLLRFLRWQCTISCNSLKKINFLLLGKLLRQNFSVNPVRKDTDNSPYQSIRCTNASSEFAKEASPLNKTASQNLNSPKDDSYVGPLLSCCARRLAA